MPAIAALLPGLTPPVQPLAPVPAGEGAPDFADLFGNAAASGGKTLPDAPVKAGKHPPREVLPAQPHARDEAEAFAPAHTPIPDGKADPLATALDTPSDPSLAPAPLVFTPILGMTWIVPDTSVAKTTVAAGTSAAHDAAGPRPSPGQRSVAGASPPNQAPQSGAPDAMAAPMLSLVPAEHRLGDMQPGPLPAGAATSAPAVVRLAQAPARALLEPVGSPSIPTSPEVTPPRVDARLADPPPAFASASTTAPGALPQAAASPSRRVGRLAPPVEATAVSPAPASTAPPLAAALGPVNRPALTNTGVPANAPTPTPADQPAATTPQPERSNGATRPAPSAAAPLAPVRRTAADTAALLGARPAAASRTSVAAPAITPLAERIELPTATPVAQTAQAPIDLAPSPIDTARPTWPTAMVDHIERLRDDANAVSTSIRLLPDALGAIDVSVKQDGEVTHVHLAAEQPQTRALLAEASPKLAEIAEQRGVKLGQTEIGGGSASTSHGQQQSAQQQTRQPAAPARAARTAIITPDDSRIA